MYYIRIVVSLLSILFGLVCLAGGMQLILGGTLQEAAHGPTYTGAVILMVSLIGFGMLVIAGALYIFPSSREKPTKN